MVNSSANTKYIGLSVDEFVDLSSADLKAMDEGRVPEEVRKGYAALISGLSNQRARLSTYFFVYSKFICLKLEF